ncbi:hypothetical protein XELAEV_18045279mg [Xenopus laevis]|uniref:Saposin B-type domain-containing protein n=1 Tax=Xenopus laevis TaxID=8355 RepID=A0A974C0C8_XENLA|nr:hypothetical protein XELAEV_18045279mg [Xenopus laevis]
MNGALWAVLWSFVFSAWAEVELPPGVDHRMYCESCLATVQELKKSLSPPTGETSGTKIKAQATKVCNALTLKKESFSSDKARIACNHLLGKKKTPYTIYYIHTKACTGVKRERFKSRHFDDGAVEEFLQKHVSIVRRTKAVVPEGRPVSQARREELGNNDCFISSSWISVISP